jgi:hypothetical protein
VEAGRLGAQPFAMVHAAADPDWDLAALRETASRVEARLRGSRGDARNFLTMNAAADPERNALARMTSCRSVAGARWSTEPPEGDFEPWHAAWSRQEHGYGIVYGHWSLQGLHRAPWLRGIDTGCVHEGRGRPGFLTAWIPDPSSRRPFELPDDSFWQERARRRYYKGSDDR